MKQSIDKEIGIRLMIARKSAGYKTAIEFSTAHGIAKTTYSQHERGVRSLTAGLLEKYANLLNINCSWLLTGIGQPCLYGQNSSARKKLIDAVILEYQQKKELPIISQSKINADADYSTLNLSLFFEILNQMLTKCFSKNIPVETNELLNFCIDVYASIDGLNVKIDEKIAMISIAISSIAKVSELLDNSKKPL